MWVVLQYNESKTERKRERKFISARLQFNKWNIQIKFSHGLKLDQNTILSIYIIDLSINIILHKCLWNIQKDNKYIEAAFRVLIFRISCFNLAVSKS